MAELDVTRGNYTLAVVPALIVVVGACLQPETTVCASGMRCPGGQVCDSIHLLCVFPDQLASCQGEADGDRSTALGGEGECDREVCLLSICGDGVVGPQEVCDDGPLAEGAAPEDGDGCSADCRSDET